jgi:hypothetical protein
MEYSTMHVLHVTRLFGPPMMVYVSPSCPKFPITLMLVRLDSILCKKYSETKLLVNIQKHTK